MQDKRKILFGGVALIALAFPLLVSADAGLDNGYMTIHTQMNKNDFGFLDKEYHGWAGLPLNGGNTGGGGNGGGGGAGSIDPLAPWEIEDAGLRAQVLAIVTSQNGEDPATYELIGQDALDFDYADIVTFGTPLNFGSVTTLAGMEQSNLTEIDSFAAYALQDGRGVENIETVNGAFELINTTDFDISFASLEVITGNGVIYGANETIIDFPELTMVNNFTLAGTSNAEVSFSNSNTQMWNLSIGGGSAFAGAYSFGENFTANQIEVNGANASYDFGNGSTVTESLEFNGGTIAAGTNFDGITSVGTLEAWTVSSVDSLAFDGLETSRSIAMGTVTAPSISFENLTSLTDEGTVVGGTVDSIDMHVTTDSISFPNLANSQGVTVTNQSNNSNTINLNSLENTNARGVYLSGNFMSAVSLPALSSSNTISIYNNGDVSLDRLTQSNEITIAAGNGATVNATQLETITENLSIRSDSGNLEAVNLDNLEFAENLLISNSGTVNIPSLTTINSDYELIGINNIQANLPINVGGVSMTNLTKTGNEHLFS